MNILAMDTSAKTTSVSISADEQILAEFSVVTRRTHSQTLMPMLEAAALSCDMPLEAIDLYAVSNGPGSFTGGLGAGKTAFVRGLAQGLGCSDEVSSPTFSLVHEYDGPVTLYHFDMYRIHSLDELYSTGFFDYLDCGGIMAIEWSENIAAVLEQERCIAVSIEPDDENIRIITVNGGDRF